MSDKNHYIVILILIIIIINITLITWPLLSLYFSEGNFYHSYPLIDPARIFTDQKHFIVNLQPLREELRELVAREGPTSITLYFEFLNTGANISINPDLKIWPASLSKLPLAMAVMKKVENGVWRFDNELVLEKEDKSILSGSLFGYPPGTLFTVGELLREMLIHSDNTAYAILSRNMSDFERYSIIDETGLEDLFDEEGRVSSKEYSRLFRTLYTSSFLKRGNSALILEWLSQSDFSQYLSMGIDKNVIFANKYGKNFQFYVYLNSGIVYIPNRPYIISVMIRGDSTKDEEDEERKAQEIMVEISKRVYQYIAHYDR
ncbi:MAG: serine hydrolase [bacterium]|nr:serine hydrolase [bacterium]